MVEQEQEKLKKLNDRIEKIKESHFGEDKHNFNLIKENLKKIEIIQNEANKILTQEYRTTLPSDISTKQSIIQEKIKEYIYEIEELLLDTEKLSLHKKRTNNTCLQILTPKQVGPICWFMAAFVAMFYSQRSRKILLDKSDSWDMKDELFKLLNDILHKKYKAVGSKFENYMNYSDDTFTNVLSLLYKKDPNKFPYDPTRVSSGLNPIYYMAKLYKLLNVDYKIFFYCIKDDIVSYSYLNYDWITYTINDEDREIKIGMDYEKIDIEKKTEYVEDNISPPILIITIDPDNSGLSGDYFKIEDVAVKTQLKSMKEEITYNGVIYKLDSIILTNYNEPVKSSGHAIAGITCKKNKYIYNGWLRTQLDPSTNKVITRKIPCELMRYDWDVNKNHFCLDTRTCKPISLDGENDEREKSEVCFNFKRGLRFLIYVRKDAKSETSAESSSSPLPPTGGKKIKYILNGRKVSLLHNNKKLQRSIYVKENGKAKYCKINKEYILLSKLKKA